MTQIDHAPLSDELEERINDRRLVSAVFLTYKFDPAFFEQEVLSLLFDAALNHASIIRLVQLEERLREVSGEIAVYYDAKGLIATGAESAKLDVRRIPILHHSGIFHPKNVFLLLEAREPSEDGSRRRSLLAGCLSANLTRAGWWENVEVCHFEEIHEGDKTLLKDDFISFLEGLKRRAQAGERGQRALNDILAFLRNQTEHRVNRSSGDILHTRFYAKGEPIVDFLDAAAGNLISGANMEIISPYFDDADVCSPLNDLIERFKPKEVRVLLPRGQSGEALCRETLFEQVRKIPNVSWAHLPKERTLASRKEDVAPRFVHAKVYRFFSRHPAREILFVGSANLTSPAHQNGGNFESAFLVELRPKGQPDFWLELESRKPKIFDLRPETDEVTEIAALPLSLQYNWETDLAEAMWLKAGLSPPIQIDSRGVPIGQIGSLSKGIWTPLGAAIADRLREVLNETSFVRAVVGNQAPAIILVQEDGMASKPSLLLNLSVTDILRYWAMLTPDQRAAFIEAKWPQGGPIGDGADLVPQLKKEDRKDTLFDRFAGFFYAFNSFEKSVRQALEEKRVKYVFSRLFGDKYDSLPTLLNRLSGGEEGDPVDRYVIVRCADQLIAELKADYQEFWLDNSRAGRALSDKISALKTTTHQELVSQTAGGMSDFLDWFDRRFIKRAKPVEALND